MGELLGRQEMDTRAAGYPELARPIPQTIFQGVVSYLNVQFAAPLGYRPLTLDLHVPHGADEAVPVAVYGHGGGFLTGTKSMGPWKFLLDAGIAVAAVDYRLSGEARFPEPVHDVAAAVRWVRTNASTYGLDADRIIGFGSSAGGYLVGAVALAAGDQALLGSLGPTPDQSAALSAVIDHYAPTDFVHIDEDAPADVLEISNAPGTSASLFLGFIPVDDPERAEVATLATYAAPSAPPFLIFHGNDDHRVGAGQSRRLRDALVNAGAAAELVIIAGADHGSPEFDQPDVQSRTLEFLRSLGLTPGTASSDRANVPGRVEVAP